MEIDISVEPLRFRLGTSGQVLILQSRVLHHFSLRRQRCLWQKEAGGQLFARFDQNQIIVEEATGPRRTDRRTRTIYQADRTAEQREIEAKHSVGLHYVGDWHTHPTQRPEPSRTDLSTISGTVARSRHSLNSFILIIVGTDSKSAGLCVLLHNGQEHLRLYPDIEES